MPRWKCARNSAGRYGTTTRTDGITTRLQPRAHAHAPGRLRPHTLTNCSNDSGSDGCVQALTDSIGGVDQIISAINASNVAGEYPRTIAEITKLVNAADAYTKDECARSPAWGPSSR